MHPEQNDGQLSEQEKAAIAVERFGEIHRFLTTGKRNDGKDLSEEERQALIDFKEIALKDSKVQQSLEEAQRDFRDALDSVEPQNDVEFARTIWESVHLMNKDSSKLPFREAAARQILLQVENRRKEDVINRISDPNQQRVARDAYTENEGRRFVELHVFNSSDEIDRLVGDYVTATRTPSQEAPTPVIVVASRVNNPPQPTSDDFLKPESGESAWKPTGDKKSEEVNYQKKQYELFERQLRRGILSFTKNELAQAGAINNLESQNWYLDLSEDEKVELSFRNKMLKALESKQKGNKGMEEFMGNLRLDRRELSYLSNKEGFRMSLATLTTELFERNSRGMLVLKTLEDDDGKEIGVEKIGDVRASSATGQFDDYRATVIDRLTEHLIKTPEDIGFNVLNSDRSPEKVREAARSVAEGYVAAAWNLLSVGLAVESGDDSRMMSSSSSVAFNSHWRRFLHPFNDARSNWVRDKAEKVGTEEDLFGTLGVWFRERIGHDPKFANDFVEYKKGSRFFLERTAGSLFDHTKLKNGKTLTEAILDTKKKGDMHDFSLEDGFTFDDLEGSDIGKEYANKLDSVYKIQSLITTDEEKVDKKATDTFSNFIQGLNQLQKMSSDGDKVLSLIYTPDQSEDLVIAAIGAISGGFVTHTTYKGQTELLLAVPFGEYDAYVDGLLTYDSRLYRVLGVNPQDKRQVERKQDELRRRVNAEKVSIGSYFSLGYSRRDDIMKNRK